MKTVYIGRNTGNDVVLSDPFVSGKHACIIQNDEGSYTISDLGSKNGTFVNGFKITQSALHYNDIVKLGEFIIPWQQYFITFRENETIGKILTTYSIGRNPKNDIVINDEFASAVHAFLDITYLKQAIIRDNNSSNGTFVNNQRVNSCFLHPGDDLKIAHTNLQWMQFLPSSSMYQVKKMKKKSNLWIILAIVFTSFIILSISIGYLVNENWLFNRNNNDSILTEKFPAFNDLKDLVKYAEKAVFLIETKNNNGKPVMYATGFFVNSNGIGITNAHVLQGGRSLTIKTNDGQFYQIDKVLKTNSTYDYAIFRVKADRNFPVLKISDETLAKGQDIFVLGNPQGIESTLTKGIISGFKGGIEKDIINGNFGEGNTYIQLDVALSHGSSGSPVMNMKGKVIGIATLSFAQSNCVNCNFAININVLKSDLNNIIE